MKKLLENWRKFQDSIEEGMKTPQDLKKYDGEYHVHVELDPAAGAKIKLTDRNHNEAPESGPVYGFIYIAKTDSSTGSCSDAWQVQYVRAHKGWGPLLYEIALEIASQEANGLMPDRAAVSDKAHNVWKYYFKRREEVGKSQLDDLQNTLTPIKADNCLQRMAKSRDEFPGGPLSFRYYKLEPEMVKQLQEMGLIMFTEY